MVLVVDKVDGATNGGGGGGGSGYTDGSVTVIDTQQGGSTGAAKVIIRIADPSTIDPSTTLQEVTFTIGRSAAYSNTITFVKWKVELDQIELLLDLMQEL